MRIKNSNNLPVLIDELNQCMFYNHSVSWSDLEGPPKPHTCTHTNTLRWRFLRIHLTELIYLQPPVLDKFYDRCSMNCSGCHISLQCKDWKGSVTDSKAVFTDDQKADALLFVWMVQAKNEPENKRDVEREWLTVHIQSLHDNSQLHFTGHVPQRAHGHTQLLLWDKSIPIPV